MDESLYYKDYDKTIGTHRNIPVMAQWFKANKFRYEIKNGFIIDARKRG